MNVYPPFVGAGIRVEASPDLVITTTLELRSWNKNFIGAQFGGSLYSMCDPFFVLLLADKLGPDYLVIDKSATVHFRKLGRGTVRARFAIDATEVERIKAAADERGRDEPKFTAQVLDETGIVVAEVEKIVYVRKKRGASWEQHYG